MNKYKMFDRQIHQENAFYVEMHFKVTTITITYKAQGFILHDYLNYFEKSPKIKKSSTVKPSHKVAIT